MLVVIVGRYDADEVFGELYHAPRYGLFFVGGYTSNPIKMRRAIASGVALAKNRELSEEDLEFKKRKITGRAFINGDSPEALAKEFSFWWARGVNYGAVIDRIQALTPQGLKHSCWMCCAISPGVLDPRSPGDWASTNHVVGHSSVAPRALSASAMTAKRPSIALSAYVTRYCTPIPSFERSEAGAPCVFEQPCPPSLVKVKPVLRLPMIKKSRRCLRYEGSIVYAAIHS